MEIILGIDQGSTHTRAAACNTRGEILGAGRSYGACHSVQGMEPAMRAAREAAEMALRQAGVRPGEVRLVFGGLTGADWPDEYPLLERNLQALGLGAQVRVVNDSIIALRGGTRSPYGAIVIAGSGGNCAVRSPDGREFIYHFYQEEALQGGHALGRKMLTAVYRAETGREPATRLTAIALEYLGMDTVDQLLRAQFERRLPVERVRALAPLLLQAACDGDEVALKITHSFGAGLAELVTAGLRRFHMTGLDVDVVLSGSVFKGPGSILEDIMAVYIQKTAPQARLINARYEPIVGALLCGIEALGIMVDEQVLGHIERTSTEFQLIRIQPAEGN